MLKRRFTRFASAALASTSLALSPLSVQACTSFMISAKDGSRVYGRTMEFGLPLQSELIVMPRGYTFKGTGPDGTTGTGLEWTGKYGAFGANGLGLPVLIDGMNEKGLAGGLLFFPDLARFQDVPASEAKNSIASFELLTWILTNFATVEEVKAELPKIKVSTAPQVAFNGPVPLHVTLHDLAGKSLVIEYVDGKLNMHDNPTGVMTNAPAFPWHLTNLGLYGNLSADEPGPRKVGNLTIAQPSTGAGLHGLPGDVLSPSRFVRAFMFTQNLPELATGLDAMNAARHILNNFDIPPGAVATQAGSSTGGGVAGFETTEWTVAADLKNGVYSIWDYANQSPRYLTANELDLDAKAIRFIPFNQKPAYLNLSK